MPAARAKAEAAEPVEPAEDRGHDVPPDAEVDEARVHLVQANAIHAGVADDGTPLDHLNPDAPDHVIEVSN